MSQFHPLPVPPPLGDIIEKAPFAKVLKKRRYLELSKERSEELNLNWTRHPEARLVAGQMLAGAILYNVKSGKGILVNEVEVYGRGRMEDCHREQTGKVKDVPRASSVPSTLGVDHYEGVHPVTTGNKDCRRLVIGTKTCDVLVTSCVGLDDKTPISVGSETLNFKIMEADVEHIRIFLDSEQVEAAKNMVGKSVLEITKNMAEESLRQLKTKFDQLDTYDFSRCSGPLTARTLYQPWTIFTIANHGNGTGVAQAVGGVFYKIGRAVILHGEEAILSRKEVIRDWKMCKASKEFGPPLEAIVGLFGKETEMTIIGNAALNQELEKLATRMSRSIADANKDSATNIRSLFGLKLYVVEQ